ncbi:MAG TPA: outer membrane protein transport protein [Methylophilus sp.]|nr:outer membrane protein transport protein [Methylophilus sp.]HQQ34141.1 outer membrane protein transport protein [Methylophilus sp.]
MYKKIFACVIFTTPAIAQAAGFALIEQSGSGMGNAYAGASAVAEDASTIFFNPAGMTYIQGTQAVGALHLIKPSAEFNNQGSVAANSVFAPAVFRPLGGDGGDAGDLAFVPNFYFKTDITDQLQFGVGVNAPFGLKTEYDKDWLGRFQGIKSEVKTVNINPALAFKVNDQLSVGFGISAMWIEAKLTSAVNLGAAERFSKVKGDDWGFGFNLGAIYQVTPDTRLGVAYRSKVEQHLDGDVKFSTSTFPTLNSDVKADVTLPETFSVSAFSRMNDTWDLMADVTWTRWSQFKELAIYRDSGTPLTKTIENWDNTLRYSVGVNYHYSDTIKLRAGLAYDEEAIKDEYRTVRIPGNDRKWLALGASWQVSPTSKFDVGYAHLFISDAKIDDNQTAISATSPFSKGRVKGEYDGSVDILSLQYTHNF